MVRCHKDMNEASLSVPAQPKGKINKLKNARIKY